MNRNKVQYFIVLMIIFAMLMGGCTKRLSTPIPASSSGYPGPITYGDVVDPTEVSPATIKPETTKSASTDTPTTAPEPTATATAIPTATSVTCSAPTDGYKPFDPANSWDLTKLPATAPTQEEFLKLHGLTGDMIQKVTLPDSSQWEPAMYVVELKPQYYGKVTIPQLEGFAYTDALADNSVQNFWGGDPAVTCVTLQWGFTARWYKSYERMTYQWLDVENPYEWVVRDYRFGRYLRNEGVDRVDVSYFTRFGPYVTLPGNANVPDWTPPTLSQTQPNDYLQAAGMLGGLANSSEWTHSEDGLNWAWKYTDKVFGSASYCPSGMPCWQTTYVPNASKGYIELWDGALGASRKFYATDMKQLLSGNYNVDEFSYHANPTK